MAGKSENFKYSHSLDLIMGKIKIQEKEFTLESKDEALILTLQLLTVAIKQLSRKL